MSFTSLIFLFGFLPVSMILYLFVPQKQKNLFLLIISLIFYSWGEPLYVFLMIFIIVFSYVISRYIFKESGLGDKDRKFVFVVAVVVTLAGLMFYKYYGFLINNINVIFRAHLKIRQLPLPLGISFFTFKVLSYLADCYKGDCKPQRSLINLALYVSIFPEIGAGPITQYNKMEEELDNRRISATLFGIGAEKFILGLGKKVIIANNLAMLWSSVKAVPNLEISSMTAWIGILAYAFQIYFDFSGYSDMAIGLGNMLGFTWDKNFNYPYISASIREFWKRWHISLGSWFKDYIYIPLGGNRKGIKKEIRNMFVVWAVTGLWHGASWNFVMWGLYFGFLIFLEKTVLKDVHEKLPRAVTVPVTFLLILFSWIMFDLSSVRDIFHFLGTMFGIGAKGFVDSQFMYLFKSYWVLLVCGFLGMSPFALNIIKGIRRMMGKRGRVAIGIYYGFIVIISTAMLVAESYSPFLYFKF